MAFLGIRPILLGDVGAMACFAFGALLFGAPWWLCPFIGIAAWRALAR